jgi:hypothetical protein
MNDTTQSPPLAKRTDLRADSGPTLDSADATLAKPSAHISLNSTSCYARSFGNPQSRLFWCDGQLFCALAKDQAALIHKLERTGTMKDLTQHNLLAQSEPAAIAVEGFDLVRKIVPTPRVSYVYEWCPAMWKDAAQMMINMLSELLPRNLTLRNPHPWNVLFFGCRPLYIDQGSIVRFQEESFWRSYEKLCRFLIHPLLLNAMGQSHVGRRMLHDINAGVRSEDFPHLASFTLQLKQKYRESELSQFLRRLQRAVEDIVLPDPQTKWTGYHGVSSRDPSKWSSKDKTIHRVLLELRPNSILDIGCNEGWYSRLAESLGHEVTAIDADEICVNHLYHLVRSQNRNILPAVIDFTNPSPGYGVANRWFPPATGRLASDMVLALAIEHHLVFGRYRLTFDEVARGFASFSKRWLLIEFISPGGDTNANPVEWRPESIDWYNIDCFVAALRAEFCTVTKLPDTNDDRILLLCEKRE